MTSSFQRKVVYLALIAALLVPLSLISRPETVSVGGDAGSAGGKLAQLRKEYKLGQAQVGQVDPTSAAVRYASLGFHGLAGCILWNKVDEYQKDEDWVGMSSVLKQLTVLQPYYVKVWSYQAWNVSYNVASKWDDYRDKYYWVIGGFKMLARGMEFNELEAQLPYELGWMAGHKIGQADERREFRILFSRDDDFHRLPWVQERAPDVRDNWLFGKRFLEYSQKLVDSMGAVLRSLGAEAFNEQPAIAQTQYAIALETDGTFGEDAREAWRKAHEEWYKVGEREFPTDLGFSIRYNDLESKQQRLADAKKRFAEQSPGLRDRLTEERRAALAPEERRALDTSKDARTTAEQQLAYEAERKMSFDETAIAELAEPEKREELRRLGREVVDLRIQVQAIKSSREIFNYDYWLARTELEATDEALAARRTFSQALAEADEKPWAAKKTFEEGFQLWRKVVDKYPQTVDDQTAYEVKDLILAYQRVLQQLDEPFDVAKFVLRDILEKNQ